jgi:uncharacterized protein GlcG (DUF336 family)
MSNCSGYMRVAVLSGVFSFSRGPNTRSVAPLAGPHRPAPLRDFRHAGLSAQFERMVIIGVLYVFLPAPVSAQGLVTQKALSYEMAQAIVDGTVQKCRADGFRVSVSVVDSAGLLKAFARDENTGPHTIDTSKRKAYTALTFASRWATSLEAAKEWNSKLGSPMPNVEGTTGMGGGVPIKVGDVAIGAVGVSGAVGGDKDEICARAGIARIAHLLK